MHLQLTLEKFPILKRKEKRISHATKHSGIKFRDFQGCEGSIPNLECSPHPTKDLGISGWRDLKVTHSKLPSSAGIPSKASTGVQPPTSAWMLPEKAIQSFVVQPNCPFWCQWWTRRGKTSATIVQFGKTRAWETGYCHGAALKYSGM